jgi:hypothetical protein
MSREQWLKYQKGSNRMFIKAPSNKSQKLTEQTFCMVPRRGRMNMMTINQCFRMLVLLILVASAVTVRDQVKLAHASTLDHSPPALSGLSTTLSPSPAPPATTPFPPRSSTPTSSRSLLSTVATVKTSWPLPADVKFDLDDKISTFNKGVIQDGIAIGQDAFGIAGPIVIYARTNLNALMDAYYRHEKISADNPKSIRTRRLFETGFTTTFSTIGAGMYFYASDKWLNKPRAERMREAAHEYFHQIQFALSGRNPQGLPAPDWLIEGSADYEAFRLFVEGYQFQEFERVRAINKDRIWGLHSQLSSLDTMDHAHAEDSSAAWTLGLVATEFLAKNYGEQGVMKKYWEARSTQTWKDAFRTAFGISTAEFYKKFEEYRRTNFPSYCSPSRNQTSLAIRLERQLSTGSFHAFPATYIPYVFCVSGTQVGTWTNAQKEAGFKKPTGATDVRVNFCGGNCVVLAIRQDTLPGTYTFAVEAPDGRKAETLIQYIRATSVRPTLPATPPVKPIP